MAFSVKKFNARKFDMSPAKDTPYMKLSELDATDAPFIVGALYVNKKSKFGASPVAAIVGVDEATGESGIAALVNLPKFQLDAVESMIEDEEAVAAINAGKVGFTIREYYSETYAVNCYSAEWVDL